jgi:hypothetical protein
VPVRLSEGLQDGPGSGDFFCSAWSYAKFGQHVVRRGVRMVCLIFARLENR